MNYKIYILWFLLVIIRVYYFTTNFDHVKEYTDLKKKPRFVATIHFLNLF